MVIVTPVRYSAMVGAKSFQRIDSDKIILHVATHGVTGPLKLENIYLHRRANWIELYIC